MPYVAIDRDGLVLGSGPNPDAAIEDAQGFRHVSVFRVVQATRSLVACHESGAETYVILRDTSAAR